MIHALKFAGLSVTLNLVWWMIFLLISRDSGNLDGGVGYIIGTLPAMLALGLVRSLISATWIADTIDRIGPLFSQDITAILIGIFGWAAFGTIIGGLHFRYAETDRRRFPAWGVTLAIGLLLIALLEGLRLAGQSLAKSSWVMLPLISIPVVAASAGLFMAASLLLAVWALLQRLRSYWSKFQAMRRQRVQRHV